MPLLGLILKLCNATLHNYHGDITLHYFKLGEQDFYLDLLFYHLKLRRYIVIELKARKFEVGDGAQLEMYMHAEEIEAELSNNLDS